MSVAIVVSLRRLQPTPCRAAAWAWPAALAAALMVGGGCISDDGAAAVERIKPAKLFDDDFTEDEAWRAKVKKDSFPAAGPDGL